MVNNDPVRLVQYVLPPSPFPTERQLLKLPGPRYKLALVKPYALPSYMRLITAKCDRDVRLDLRWTIDDVAELVHALEEKHYRNSEWCATGKGVTVDCDAYVIKFDTQALEPSEDGIPLYVKFGFRPANPLLIVISCHEGFDEA